MIKKQSEIYKTYVKTSAVGLEFALAILLCTLAGYYIDKRFGFSPYGLIIGLVFGVFAGARRLWIFAKSYLEKEKNKEDNHE